MNKTFGSVLIVAGTAIGAGMLAIPLATAGVGFLPTLIILFLFWALMAYTSLLLVEVYQHSSPELGLDSLSKIYLGKPGQWLAGISILFLMYALTAAYISGAGDLLATEFSKLLNINIPAELGIILFTIIGGGIISFGTQSVDLVNRCLFILKIIFLLIVLSLMMSHVKMTNLLTMPVEQGLILSALPVIFTSFGFHGSVPSIVSYMKGDTKKLRFIFILGSAIPLVVYIVWQIATLGSLSGDTFLGILAAEAGLGGLITAAREIVGSPSVASFLNIFANLALATSFLGVTLGLFDYLADLFKLNRLNFNARLVTTALTFAPPLVFALFYPKGFIMALSYAAVALVVLALILPSLLVYKYRQTHPDSNYQVKGGNKALVAVVLVGVLIVLVQILIAMNILPAVG